MRDHLDAIAAAFTAVRPHIRSEADHLAGGLSVAIDQARAALPVDEPAAPAADATPSSSDPA
jgi:hypothetical protein